MKKTFVTVMLLLQIAVFAQDDIPWDGKYQIQLSDFKSPASQIGSTNVYSVHAANGIEFSFYMSAGEFMFTRNFNSKVKNIFKRSSASLVAPDSLVANQLLDFARFEFDLSELYSRKFRKKIYENKSAFSNVNFFKPFYDDLQKEFYARDTNAAKSTEVGKDKEILDKLHQEVLAELESLKDFCSECKPPKKK
jgi:hypothetical protein